MSVLYPVLIALSALMVGCQSSTMTAAKLYLKQNEPLKAKEQLLLTIEAEPENAEAHFLLGELYGAEGAYEEMVAQFEAASGSVFQGKIDTSRYNYWVRAYNEGATYAQGDSIDFNRSIRGFIDATLIDPSRVDAWLQLARMYYEAGKIKDAITTYEYAIQQENVDIIAFSNLGALLLREERYREAVDVFNQLIKINPSHLEGYINLAVAQVKIEDLEGAERNYKKAVAIAGNHWRSHAELGFFYSQEGRHLEALPFFLKASELDPDNQDIVFNVAVTHIKLGDLDAALPLLEQLSVRMPDNASVWRELGRIYAINGQIKQSENAYAREQELTEQ